MNAKSSSANVATNPLDKLRRLVKSDLEKVDTLIYNLIVNKIALIPEISEHTISSGGKRLRPILTLASANMCGYKGSAHIDLAACVEFIHTATLLHDDVVDKSDLRRGTSTARSLWGNKESILVGDFLLGKAFSLMGAGKSLEIYRILSNAAVVISEGEVMQLAATGKLTEDEDEYLKIISAKTAELFAAACQVGTVLAGRPEEEVTAFREFGLNLGIAFQVIDDAIDYRSGKNKSGKNIGDDLRERKVTLPVILSYRNGDKKTREFWERTIGRGEQSDDDVMTAVGIMEENDIFAKVMARANDFIVPARAALNVFPDSEIKNALRDVLEFTVDREF